MHQVRSANDITTEGMTDGLVAEAHPEDGLLAGEGLDHRARDTGFGGRARTGRNHHAVRIQRQRFLDGDLVIAVHLLLHAQLPEVLDQVVGERIVVIDDQQHVRTICPALRSVKEPRPRVNK